MTNQMPWKYVFQLKAVINWVESVFLLFSDRWIREVLNREPLLNPEYLHLFLTLVFVIGIGYWWVGKDIERHLGIVKLGIIAQYSVFGVLAYHTFVNKLHPFYLTPGIIDLTFAIIFSWFLYSYTRNQPALE